ncbi:MAG: hypothetical protein KAR40_07965 [Candidatus Sabulitectum sp.]|nr:hypothetical protein [Candidatus Sabulitectum sp.]
MPNNFISESRFNQFGVEPPAPPTLLNPRTRSVQDAGVCLPFNFQPREYQERDLFRQMFPHHYPDLREQGIQRKRRICTIWHRRAGKDKSLINVEALAAYEEVGNYLYLLPEQTQARKIIWRGIDGNGFRFLDHIPDEICKGGARGKYSSEMLVELTNGSTIQFGGSDNYNSWMGTNPKGIVFSEYSLQDPMAWQYFRPILVENGGWAIFNYTVRGKNHGYDLAQIAQKNPKIWYYSYLPIDKTKRPDGSPVITHEQYLEEIENGMPKPIARQEFYLDWEAALFGSYYGDLIEIAYAEKRVGFHPHEPGKPCFAAWDVGLDCNSVWIAQEKDGQPVLIDYYEKVDEKFSITCKNILNKPYSIHTHFMPHDFKNRDSEKGSRAKTAEQLGMDCVETPRIGVADGIEEVRQFLPRCRINDIERDVEDGGGPARGIDGVRSYERVYDSKLQRFREQPVHNWASHSADALRYLALNWEDGMTDDNWFNKDLEVPENDLT